MTPCLQCEQNTPDSIQISDSHKPQRTCSVCGNVKALGEQPSQKNLNTIQRRETMVTLGNPMHAAIDKIRAEITELEGHIESVSVYRARVKLLKKKLKVLESE